MPTGWLAISIGLVGPLTNIMVQRTQRRVIKTKEFGPRVGVAAAVNRSVASHGRPLVQASIPANLHPAQGSTKTTRGVVGPGYDHLHLHVLGGSVKMENYERKCICECRMNRCKYLQL